MKLKLLLLLLIICNTVSANMSSIEAEARQLASERLDGKYLDVRVYNTSANASSEYETARVRLKGISFSHKDIKQAIPEIDDSQLLVVAGIDQTDKAIATVLDKYVSLSNFNVTKIQNIWPEMSHDSNISNMIFLDALGNPIPDAMIEVRINLSSARGRGFSKCSEEPIYSDVLGSDGKYQLPVWTNAQAGFVYVVSHPNYGTALVQNGGIFNKSNIFILPLVPLDSEAGSCSFKGFVVDDSDEPVASIPVYLNANDNGNGLKQYSKTNGIVITDTNGQFYIYPPLEIGDELYTELAPGTTRYNLRIQPDKSLNLLSYENTFLQREFQVGDEPKKIILRRMNPDQYFHTFTFEDEQGVISDQEKLAKITITVSRDNRIWQTLKYDQFKDGCYLNLGKLNASMMRGNKQLRFSEINLTEDTPQELALTTGQVQIYSGMVIDAATGQPVPDILILGESGPRKDEDYAKLKEQSGELRLRALSEFLNGLSDEQLYETEMRFALTDQDGRYQFIFRNGFGDYLEYFNVIEKNYHTRRMYLFEAEQPEEEGVFNIKTIELLPPPRIKQPPVFVFEDERGNEITDPNILEKININVKLSENSSKGGNYESMIPKSMHWDYGTYSARLNYGDLNYVYEPVVIDQECPEVIIFKIKQELRREIIVTGRVVNGITNEPMPGVIVYVNDDRSAIGISSNSNDYLEIINSIEYDYDIESPVIQELMSALDATALTLTDKDGRYELPVEQQAILTRGHGASLIGIKKDFMGARQGFSSLLPDDKNDSESDITVNEIDNTQNLPDMWLFPSGQVKLELNLPDMTRNNHERTRVICQFVTSPSDTTLWLDRLWGTSSERGGSRVIRPGELRPNGKQIISLPAGLEVSLIMYTLNKETGGVIFHNIKLEQGQKLDLGLIEFPETYMVNVKVTDILGNPIPNVPVSSLDEFRLYRGQQVKTNSDGIASLYVTPDSSGSFVVSCQDQETKETLRKAIFYEVKGTEDAGKEFLLQLPDDMLENLLK